jgi:hypothetical protein
MEEADFNKRVLLPMTIAGAILIVLALLTRNDVSNEQIAYLCSPFAVSFCIHYLIAAKHRIYNAYSKWANWENKLVIHKRP